MREIDCIIIHCSVTEQGREYSAKDIDRWHRERGFKCIGYHYVIGIKGNIEKGRPEGEQGAHCTGRNATSVGICYIGGLKNGKASDTRTKEQREALLELVHDIVTRYGIPTKRIYTHNLFAAKDCPCFSADSFRKEYEERYR